MAFVVVAVDVIVVVYGDIKKTVNEKEGDDGYDYNNNNCIELRLQYTRGS